MTSQDKIRRKTPFGIEYTRRYFIVQNKHQYVKSDSEETFAIYPTYQILVNSSLEYIDIYQDVFEQHKSS